MMCDIWNYAVIKEYRFLLKGSRPISGGRIKWLKEWEAKSGRIHIFFSSKLWFSAYEHAKVKVLEVLNF